MYGSGEGRETEAYQRGLTEGLHQQKANRETAQLARNVADRLFGPRDMLVGQILAKLHSNEPQTAADQRAVRRLGLTLLMVPVLLCVLIGAGEEWGTVEAVLKAPPMTGPVAGRITAIHPEMDRMGTVDIPALRVTIAVCDRSFSQLTVKATHGHLQTGMTVPVRFNVRVPGLGTKAALADLHEVPGKWPSRGGVACGTEATPQR